ncbi:MAG: efflux RND transporter periplasmic adaptor subunit [Candidatus Eisenbacteria bacterium]|uniref:Efflux RND transporter periplasmic adaptor subunit n=1 Tax=Eiseniibacteriota bacterium TaxID=2212470 RepID=A0A933SBB5_UNCEI|nr:efflux RND transporter periplasmic adaptor subunit [Candidatus Eisenbacteria bacterium]
MNRSRWIALVAVVLVVAAGFWFVKGRGKKEAPKYRTAAIEQGELTASVSATGSVRPVIQVEVGSQVSGTLDKLYVDYNSHVKAGQVLGQLEPSVFRARYAQAEAAVARAEAALKDANRQYARAKELVRDDFISQADVDAAEVQVDQRKADLKQAKAQLDAAQADLDHTTIRSPIDGVVIARSIDVGQTVAASLSAPKLFVIANDLRQMQVETKIDEADIGRIRPGLSVTFSVDAFPDESFEGKVTQVRLEPITEQNVVTYTTVIATRNDNLSLRPGMTANVTVLVESKENVLKVPNAALRFRPNMGGGPGMGGMGGRGGMGGAGGSGGPGGGMGGMRRSFAALVSKIVPAAFAQDGPPSAERERFMNDPYVQQVREKVRNGELTREEARDMIRKHFEEQGVAMPQRGGAGGPGGPGGAGGPGGMRGGDGGAGAPGGPGAMRGEGGAGRPRGAGGPADSSGGMRGGRGAWGGKGKGGAKPGTVYILENGKPKPVMVVTGITDGSMTEIKTDQLKPGDLVVVGLEITMPKSSGLTPPPGMGGPQFGRPGGGGTGGRR